MPRKKIKIVIAGQVPPPATGQTLMVQKLLSELSEDRRCNVEHLVFRFTKNFSVARRVEIDKILELIKVIGRIILIRSRGTIDLLIFAPGGPQTVPLIRDLVLLPWILLVSKKVMLHFHAGGIGDLLKQKSSCLANMAAWLYRRADSAVVMNQFGLQDPHACGIHCAAVIPHRIQDDYQPALRTNAGHGLNLLYVGNLYDDKGTSNLLKAFAVLVSKYPEARLELGGEFHPPYSRQIFDDIINNSGITENVKLLGKISGDAKLQAFARAHLFVFPTVAPFESFGLVMAEAMMWELPVLASDWRGNREVLADSQGGMLFSPAHCSEALGEALLSIVERREHWPEMGKANRQLFINRYRADKDLKELEDFIMRRAQSEI